MKKKVSNYIAGYIKQRGIRDVFVAFANGSSPLMEAFEHHPVLSCIDHDRGKAAVMAAEMYVRMDSQMAAVCMTPDEEAIDGVRCAWAESLPMLIFSEQEEVCAGISSITKYAAAVKRAEDIRYHLERAMYLALHGCPGPVWLFIPPRIQETAVEMEELGIYDFQEDDQEIPPEISWQTAAHVIVKIKQSKSPVIVVGNEIRAAKGWLSLQRLLPILGVPVVTDLKGADMVETDHPLYAGRYNPSGEGSGNPAVQGCDLLVSVGGGLDFRKSILPKTENGYVIVNTVDHRVLEEADADDSIWGNAANLIEKMTILLLKAGCSEENPLFLGASWIACCKERRKKQLQKMQNLWRIDGPGQADRSSFFKALASQLPTGAKMIIGEGFGQKEGIYTMPVGRRQRIVISPYRNLAGYALPAAIGCYRASKDRVICVMEGAGLHFVYRELQTIFLRKMPVKLFVVNDGGPCSGPDLDKISAEYGYRYRAIGNRETLDQDIAAILDYKGAMICEVFLEPSRG